MTRGVFGRLFFAASTIDKSAFMCHNGRMKITVITTEKQSAVNTVKDEFLRRLSCDAEVKEWVLPKDMPTFCSGCGICYVESETKCHDARCFMPIWKSIETADLLVFAYPVYAFHAPASVKNLLDHLEWAGITHRPRPSVFGKRALVIVHSDGTGTKSAFKDVADSLHSWGFFDVRLFSFGTRSAKDPNSRPTPAETNDIRGLADAYSVVDFSVRAKLPFMLKRKYKAFRASRKKIAAAELAAGEPSLDTRYWRDNGWLDNKTPW